MIGNTVKKNADKTIKMPPEIEGKKGKRYNSVMGFSGSDIYMIYTNKKAYPEFLITYWILPE